ncbi:MAG: holo-ACP synthase [Planctomycetota bacterium]
MIIASGVDIVEIKKISRLIKKNSEQFIKRVFSDSEQKECLRKRFPEQHFAGKFASKEAVLKVLGTGLSEGIKWLDIVIADNKKGQPHVLLYRRAKKTAEELRIKKIFLSISHTKEYAVAFAVAEGIQQNKSKKNTV